MAISTLQMCAWCHSDYSPKKPWQKTCSYKCGYNYQNEKKKKQTNFSSCLRCGQSLADKRAQAIYCSLTCKSMDHNFKHRATTRVTGVARRRLIWERDEGMCYMCNTQLDLHQIELDHLIPVAFGGSSSETNLAVSCQKCNRSRGTRIEEAQISKLAELRT
jgi:5-methylcytosine-specific restriction endonuclease McrA